VALLLTSDLVKYPEMSWPGNRGIRSLPRPILNLRAAVAMLGVIALAGCMRSPQEPVYLDDDPSTRNRSLLDEAGIRLVFALQDECPNWEPALTVAMRKAGCGGLGTEDQKAVECRKHFACDICQFLENKTWPPAYIKVIPGDCFPLLGHVEGSTKIKGTYTPGSLRVAWVELRKARCYGPGVGIWPFWEDNVEFLAKGLIHESLHLCKIVGGYGPSTIDPTTKDYVASCF